MMFDLRIMAKAAAAALKTAEMKTIGLHAGDISPHVDIMAHMAREGGVDPRRVAELSQHYKTMGSAAPLAQAAHAAPLARAAPMAAAMKKTPTITTGAGPVLAHAAQTMGPKRVITGAVQHGMPVAGTASVLDELMHSGGKALGFIGKHAGIADRGAAAAAGVMDKAKKISPQDALRYGLPAAYGAVGGAEQLPKNRLLGAVAGGGGAVGGSVLGGRTGRAVAKGMGASAMGESFGELLGRIAGASSGQNLAVRGARLLVT